MDKMSVEELLSECSGCTVPMKAGNVTNKYQQEILSRFAEITEKVREANNCCPIRRHNDKT